MTTPGYVLVGDSQYRTWETQENAANYYGRLLVQHGDQMIPVICGHGGSMWLCAGCAEAILKQQSEDAELEVPK